MDGDSTDDDTVWNVPSRRPAASSSHQRQMSLEEIQVMRRLEDKVRGSSIIQIKDVRKPSLGETIIGLQIAVSETTTVTLTIKHTVDIVSRFSPIVNNPPLPSEVEWVGTELVDFCGSEECKSLNCIFKKISQLIDQRRLDVLMNSMRISEHSSSDDEEEPESMSSGTTAASPQSSRSTTTSIP